ncbi:MAG: hypothetical protein ACLQFF_10075 [Steroidobacteraceae bacterium]|jgi:hypothetical protein
MRGIRPQDQGSQLGAAGPLDDQRFSTRRQLARRARLTDGGAENKFVFVQLQVEESAAEGENGRGEGATQAE